MRRLGFALLLVACGGGSSSQGEPAQASPQGAVAQAGAPGGSDKAATRVGAGAGAMQMMAGAGVSGRSSVGMGAQMAGQGGNAAAQPATSAQARAGAPAAVGGGGASGGVATGATAGSAGSAAGAAGAVMGAGSAGVGGAAGGAAAGVCDRACLLDVMDRYLKAVVAHDPKLVPISASLKMTDNGVVAKPGDGLWKTATALHMDKVLTYVDPTLQNVGVQCLMDEGRAPVMYEVRLKYVAGEITEIESMTVRQADAANGFFSPDNLKPEAVFLQPPDASTRMTRDQLESITQLYLDYLEGKKSGNDVPFDAMCKRYENGLVTADGLSSFQTQSWSFQVTRRILIIDEESQITWGMFPFFEGDSPLVVGEAFKILGGKIKMIQAVMAYMPNTEWK